MVNVPAALSADPRKKTLVCTDQAVFCKSNWSLGVATKRTSSMMAPLNASIFNGLQMPEEGKAGPQSHLKCFFTLNGAFFRPAYENEACIFLMWLA